MVNQPEKSTLGTEVLLHPETPEPVQVSRQSRVMTRTRARALVPDYVASDPGCTFNSNGNLSVTQLSYL